jgi:hypothetical protein
MSGGMLRLQKSCNTDFLPGRPCTPAVHDYPRSGTGGGTCVTGGLIPDGCGWSTALGGTMYLFADYNADWIHGLTVTNRMMGTASSTATNLGSFNNSGPVSFRMGPDESLYVVMNQGNAVYRFTPRDRTGCMGGMGGAGGAGGAAPGGNAGTGTMAGMGGVGMGGEAGSVGPGGVGMGGQAGTAGPGGAGMAGATAGTGVTAGAGGSVSGTGGSVPTGGVGANGGAPVGGAPGGGLGPTAGSDSGGNDIDTSGGCGCRAAKPSGAGYMALVLGIVLTIGARLWRRRRGE